MRGFASMWGSRVRQNAGTTDPRSGERGYRTQGGGGSGGRRLFLRRGLALAVLLLSAHAATAGEPVRLDLAPVANQVARILKEAGQSAVSLGSFASPAGTAAGPGISKALADELLRLGVKVEPGAAASVRGKYTTLKDGQDRPRGVRIVTEVELKGKRYGSFNTDVPFLPHTESTEGDGTPVLAPFLAVTGTLPPDKSLKERQQKFWENEAKAPAHVEGKRVFAAKNSPYALEVVVGGQPLPLDEKQGQVVVKLKQEDRYAVRLVNHADHAAAVALTIDGLSMFAFSEKKGYAHVIVPAGGTAEIKGWHITNDRSDAFEVTSYSKSEAARLLPRPERVGVLTVTFAAAWPKNTRPPVDELQAKLARSRGEELGTRRGASVDAKYREVEMHVGVVRAAISVRYSQPPR